MDINTEVIELLKKGRESAFRAVFNTYFASLVLFAKGYVEDEEVAKDIIQEVFLNLWKKKTSLPEKVNLKSYLYQSARNNCLNYLKKLKVEEKYKKRALDSYDDLLLNYEALSQLTIEGIVYNELLKILENSLEQLPVKCKEVFELSRYDHMKNRDIADRLNISVKAVEGHISKALKHIRSCLNNYYASKLLLFFLFCRRTR